jgi:hypothetical protein
VPNLGENAEIPNVPQLIMPGACRPVLPLRAAGEVPLPLLQRRMKVPVDESNCAFTGLHNSCKFDAIKECEFGVQLFPGSAHLTE